MMAKEQKSPPRSAQPHPINKSLWNPLQFFSRMTFGFMTSTLMTGWKQPLTMADCFPLPTEDETRRVTDKLEVEWEKEQQKPNGSLLKALLRAFGPVYMFCGIAFFVEAGIQLAEAYFLGRVILFIQDEEEGNDGYYYAAAVAIGSFIHGVLHHVAFFGAGRMAFRAMTACTGLIYRKSLRLGAPTTAKMTSGHILNVVSTDIELFNRAVPFLHYLWIGPLLTIFVVWLVWDLLGPFALVGMGLLYLLIPVNFYLSNKLGMYRTKSSLLGDQRTKVMAELLAGMRVVKMYGWEAPFGELIAKIRKQEIFHIKQTNDVRGFNLAFFFVATPLIAFCTFASYHLAGNTLTAYKVFTSIALYNSAMLAMTLFFPSAVSGWSELRVGLKRMEALLRAKETISKQDITGQHVITQDNDPIVAKDAVFSWGDSDATDTDGHDDGNETSLGPITLTVKRGELLGVVGPVGCGKSTFLLALLQEIEASSGSIAVSGSKSYAAQEPWIFSGTIESNVYYGSEKDKDRYDDVIDVCAMRKDLQLFPKGNHTVIGERGVTLSGGQKSRLSLARAVYRDADIYLMDDPLSAVDAKVARHIFDKCISGYLADKTRILVTHQVHHLHGADRVLVLNAQGEITGLGTYQDLLVQGHNLSEEAGLQQQRPSRERQLSVVSSNGDEVAEPEVEAFEEESIDQGKVSLQSYKSVANFGGSGFRWAMIVLVMLLAQGAFLAADWFLSYWVDLDDVDREDDINVLIYAVLVILTGIFAIFRSLGFLRTMLSASRRMHNSMFDSVVHAPILFFDTNPVGRILNRFSKDMSFMDDMLPWTAMDFIQLATRILGTLLIVSVINVYLFAFTIPMLVAFVALRTFYLRSGREIKRLEATARSPVFSHFAASLNGQITIRSQQAVGSAHRQLEAFQNHHGKAFMTFLTAQRWLGFRLDFLSFSFVCVTAFGAVAARNSLDAGLVGLSLAYALRLMGSFQWCVRQSAEVENLMTSAERIIEYTKIEPEEILLYGSEYDNNNPIVLVEPEEGWPKQGSVVFDHIWMKYSDGTPWVLKDICLSVKPGEHIGVVGRTGAGKSSLINVLFRMSPTKGRLLIDGIDTSTITLRGYRSRISVIPQDPTLFSGTMRYNVDPFGYYDDATIWQALDNVRLRATVERLGGLDGMLQEKGSNFSVGERQLVCLARALLKRNRILILDEATANVDNDTDTLIQQTIREQFTDCTLITIAHRLHTIMDSDRVLVMDSGCVAEFNHPYQLLLDKQSMLSKLVKETAPVAQRILLDIAKKHHFETSSNEAVPDDGEDEDEEYHPDDPAEPLVREWVI